MLTEQKLKETNAEHKYAVQSWLSMETNLWPNIKSLMAIIWIPLELLAIILSLNHLKKVTDFLKKGEK